MTKAQKAKFQKFTEGKLKEIIDEYQKICPGVDYLDMCLIRTSPGGRRVMVTNAEEDESTRISFEVHL